MKKVSTAAQTERFYGYVAFDDPDWFKNFKVSPEFVQTVTAARERMNVLCNDGAEKYQNYTVLVRAMKDSSTRITEVNYGERNAALVLALASLLREIADIIVPINRLVEQRSNDIRQNAAYMLDRFKSAQGYRKAVK